MAADSSSSAAASAEFTLVLYNIDGREFNFNERLNAFIQYVKKDPPDVLIIQEGTHMSYEKLLREMGYLGYKRSLPPEIQKRDHGEIIFSKFPIDSIEYRQFQETERQRGMTQTVIDMWDHKICIATAQFDPRIGFKRKQIASLDTFFKKRGEMSVIFAGDTGILTYQDFHPPEGWTDSWYEAGTKKSQYTLDFNANLLAPESFHDRPDQVWFRESMAQPIECIECSLYGNDSEVTISSHFGVKARFRFC